MRFKVIVGIQCGTSTCEQLGDSHEIEETIARYSAFYPLLEALYWKVETRPLAEDGLDRDY